jgi:hypothetical protein
MYAPSFLASRLSDLSSIEESTRKPIQVFYSIRLMFHYYNMVHALLLMETSSPNVTRDLIPENYHVDATVIYFMLVHQ